jgi:hypothetical protein
MSIGRIGRPLNIWQHSIKTDIQEVELRVVDWNDLAQDRDS